MNNDTINPVVTATCTKCGIEKPLTAEFFHPRKDSKTGFRRDCRDCRRNHDKVWKAENTEKVLEAAKRWNAANAEKAREYKKRYRAANTKKRLEYEKRYRIENPDKVRAKSRRYYAENAEKLRENEKRYRTENAEKLRARAARYRQNNPDKVKAIKHRRRAREHGLPASFTSQDWITALEHFEHRCAVCGRPVGLWHSLAADHWIPISSPSCPGTIPTNIVPLCQGNGGCNNSKGASDPQEWLVGKYGKRKAKAILARIETYFAQVRGQGGG